LKQTITILEKWRKVSRLFLQHLVDVLHFHYVHSQILFSGTYLKIYIDEKHGHLIVIQYVRQNVDVGKMSVTSLFVTLSILYYFNQVFMSHITNCFELNTYGTVTGHTS